MGGMRARNLARGAPITRIARDGRGRAPPAPPSPGAKGGKGDGCGRCSLRRHAVAVITAAPAAPAAAAAPPSPGLYSFNLRSRRVELRLELQRRACALSLEQGGALFHSTHLVTCCGELVL